MRHELVERMKRDFQDEEARYAYVEDFMNSHIAIQIKGVRKFRQLSQEQLAKRFGTQQSGISRLENVNYSSWEVETLRKVARALGVRLRISFEEFGTLIDEIDDLDNAVRRREFKDDPVLSKSGRHSTELLIDSLKCLEAMKPDPDASRLIRNSLERTERSMPSERPASSTEALKELVQGRTVDAQTSLSNSVASFLTHGTTPACESLIQMSIVGKGKTMAGAASSLCRAFTPTCVINKSPRSAKRGNGKRSNKAA
jgi:transcriptional regulator with XRE-family HTH domain